MGRPVRHRTWGGRDPEEAVIRKWWKLKFLMDDLTSQGRFTYDHGYRYYSQGFNHEPQWCPDWVITDEHNGDRYNWGAATRLAWQLIDKKQRHIETAEDWLKLHGAQRLPVTKN